MAAPKIEELHDSLSGQIAKLTARLDSLERQLSEHLDKLDQGLQSLLPPPTPQSQPQPQPQRTVPIYTTQHYLTHTHTHIFQGFRHPRQRTFLQERNCLLNHIDFLQRGYCYQSDFTPIVSWTVLLCNLCTLFSRYQS